LIDRSDLIFNLQSTNANQTTTHNFIFIDHQILIKTDKPIVVSKANSDVVSNNPPGKPFHEGGDEYIVVPNHQIGILCQFVLGGRKVFSLQSILREENIDTVRR